MNSLSVFDSALDLLKVTLYQSSKLPICLYIFLFASGKIYFLSNFSYLYLQASPTRPRTSSRSTSRTRTTTLPTSRSRSTRLRSLKMQISALRYLHIYMFLLIYLSINLFIYLYICVFIVSFQRQKAKIMRIVYRHYKCW